MAKKNNELSGCTQ